MCVLHFNDYISSFLTRRHNPRGQFEDTKDEEIELWEDVDEMEDVVGVEEETIDIKENLIITDEARENKYCCEQCDYTTTSIESLTQHMKPKHEGLDTVMPSDIINLPDQTQRENISVTNDESTRNEIQGIEHGLFEEIDFLEHVQSYSGEMYSCDKCDFNTSTTKTLYRHKRTKHEEASFNCDECDYIGSQQGNLTQHKKSKHEGVKYSCDLCDNNASQLGHLKRHKKGSMKGCNIIITNVTILLLNK